MRILKTTQLASWKCRRIIEVEEFSGFPKCIAQMIAEYCVIPTLLPWIDKSLINPNTLGENPRSVEAGLIDVRMITAYTLCNPEIADHAKKNMNMNDYRHSGSNPYVWGNPALFDWLRDNYPDEEPNREALLMNTNPNVITYLNNKKILVTSALSRNNPIAFEYFLKITDEYPIDLFYGNTAATDYLGDFTGHGYELSSNSHPRAIEYLRTHQDEIDWYQFSANPAIFEYRVNPNLLAAISEEYECGN